MLANANKVQGGGGGGAKNKFTILQNSGLH